MSLSAQAKVLRALQENKISRVGSDKDIHVNVRVIAATNKNIKKEIENNNFREDLYHRISVILIHVPTLNERHDDIPLLAEHFNVLICGEYGMSRKVITPDAIKELQNIQWTGNVREFRNVLERLIILCPNEITGNDVLAYAKPVSGAN
jgi:transcriptional regulator with GAF, ATPase, and Fis domain